MIDMEKEKSRNVLAYFGATKFNVLFLALYIVGALVLAGIVDFVLEGMQLKTERLTYIAIAGTVIGIGMYAWDLWKARKAE